VRGSTLRERRLLGLVVALGALVTFAVFGGTGLAGSTAKPVKAQYGPGQYQNANKVTICHKGNVTIRVSVNALPGHKAHGDVVGTCAAAAAAAKAKQAKIKQAKDDTSATDAAGPTQGNGKSQNSNGKSQGNGKGNGKS
jgi:hypothetical protein